VTENRRFIDLDVHLRGWRSLFLMSDAQYQTLRSISDELVFVICRDGRFYEDLPLVSR
jgi:hypothetical protein